MRHCHCQCGRLHRWTHGSPPPPCAVSLPHRQAREASFRSIKTIAECLADEIVNASKGSSSSYAIKKKDEVERVSKANR